MKLRSKLWMFYTLFAVTLLIVMAINLYFQNEKAKELSYFYNEIIPGTIAFNQLESSFLLSNNYVKEYGTSRDSATKLKANKQLKDLKKYLIIHESKHRNFDNIEHFDIIEKVIANYEKAVSSYFLSISSDASKLEIKNNEKILDEQISIFMQKVHPLLLDDMENSRTFATKIGKRGNNNSLLIIAMIFAPLFISVIFGYLLTISITIPIKKLMRSVGKFGDGDFGEKIDISILNSNNEVGKLAQAFKRMKDNVGDIIGKAEQVAQGDYSIETISRSSRDALGSMLQNITKSFREKDEYNKAILDSTQAGVVLINAETHIIEYVNPAASDMVGLDSDNIIGHICHKFICPALEGECPISDKGLELDNSEKTLLTADGRYIPILKTVKTIVIGGRNILIETFIDISKMKELQLKLAQDEEKYYTMFQSSPAAVIMTDRDGIIADINNRVEDWLGFPAAPIIGKKVLELPFLTKNARKRIIREQIARRNGKELSNYQLEFLDKDGNLHLGSILVNEIKSYDDKIMGSIVTILDITKEEESKRLLKENEKRFKDLFENSNDAIFIHTIDEEMIVEVNKRASELVGYSKEELLQMTVYNLAAESDRALHRSIRDSESLAIETKFKQKNGNIIWVDVRAKIIDQQKGLVQGIVRNISDVKLTRNKLLIQEEKYRSMFDSVNDAIYLLKDKRFIDCNLATIEMFEMDSKEDFLATSPKNISPLKQADGGYSWELSEQLLRKTLKENVVKAEWIHQRKNGEIFPAEVILTKIEAGGSSFIHINVRDITKRKKQEALEIVNRKKYHNIFNMTPISIWQEDFSQVKDMLDELKNRGVYNIRKYLNENPNFVIDCIKKIIITDVNQQTLKIFEAKDKKELYGSLDKIFVEATSEIVTNELVAIFEGRKSFSGETINKTLNGKLINISLKMTIPSENESFKSVLVSMIDITARKQAELKLKKAQIEMKEIMNASSPICAIDKNYTIFRVNNSFNELVDIKNAKNIMGKKCYDILKYDICGTENCMLKKVIRGEKNLVSDLSCNFQNGNISNGNIKVNSLQNEMGDMIGIVESFTDITKLKQSAKEIEIHNIEIKRKNWIINGQKKLNDSMQGNLNLVEISQKIISFLAKYVDAQVGAIYILEEEKEKLILEGSYAISEKSLITSFAWGEGLIGQVALENEMMNLQNIPSGYLKINTAFGSTAPKGIIIYPFSMNNKVLGVIELGSITPFSEDKLEFVAMSMIDIAISINSSLARAESRDLLKKTQQQASELVAQQEELRVTNETLVVKADELSIASESLKIQQEELKATNEELEEKTNYLENNRKELNEKNRTLNGAQKELNERAGQLELASKYKSEFLANMSHELRTPLNSLLILSNHLAKNKPGNLNEKQVESAKIINSSGTDLLDLINEILDLSKIEAGKMSVNLATVDVQEIEHSVRRNFAHQFERKHLELRFFIAKDFPKSFQSDVQRLQQIIKNLLSNSLKFTSEGYIAVDFFRPSKDVDLSYSNLDYRKSIAFSVKDSGIGIKPDKLDAIFEAFQQEDGSTSRKYGGTGLGLSISRALSNLLGGEIQLQSEVGVGSTFTVYLPESLNENSDKDDGKEITEKKKSTEKIVEKKIDKKSEIIYHPNNLGIKDDRKLLSEGDNSVLIIEDDLNFAKVLKGISNGKGLKFIHAADGESGLGLAKEYLPSSIILDLNLPGIDGWEVLDRLKADEALRHIPVHIMSANDKISGFYERGAIGYITKPATEEELENTFSKLEEYYKKDINTILIVEDDVNTQKVIKEVIRSKNVEFEIAVTGEEACQKLKTLHYDCVILDIGLPDISGFEILEKIQKLQLDPLPPIIIYTGKELSKDEEIKLRKYARSIIVKGKKSADRLVDEVALYLHQVVKDLPAEKQQIIRKLHNLDTGISGKNILVVDDDIRNVFAVTSALEEHEINVFTADNGLEAIKVLKENKEIDLVLMDIMMPVMNGYEAMEKIREMKEFANLPILALTAKAMREDKEKCIKAGANDYLAKPLDIDRLISMIRVWLN